MAHLPQELIAYVWQNLPERSWLSLTEFLQRERSVMGTIRDRLIDQILYAIPQLNDSNFPETRDEFIDRLRYHIHGDLEETSR